MRPAPASISVTNNLQRDACPLCARAARAVGALHTPSPTRFSTHWITLERTPELWRCEHCGSSFTQHALPEDVALRLYREGDGAQRWSSSARFEATKTREAVATLRRLISPKMRVLDLGCNTGELLDFARTLGAVTHGVEPSRASRDIARSRGHDVVATLDEARGPFEVITAFDVLEHVYEPVKWLGDVAARLVPHGRFVALTGDITCAAARRDGAAWWYVQFPEHVVFPSRVALEEIAGLRLEATVSTFAEKSYEPGVLRRVIMALRGVRREDVHDHMLVVLKRV